MELARTSRSCVQAVGVIEEPDGSKHKVSFTSVDPAEQIIVLVDPGQLTVEIDHKTVPRPRRGKHAIRVRIVRGTGLSAPVKIELVSPPHIHGITAEPVTIPADQTSRHADGEVCVQTTSARSTCRRSSRHVNPRRQPVLCWECESRRKTPKIVGFVGFVLVGEIP